MKHLLYTFLLFSFFITTAQSNLNLKDGFIAEGYDVVSYFENNAEEGHNDFSYTYNGAKYKFTTQEHLKAFKENPEKYMPQYGGFCAYAIAEKGKKVSINPEAFEIRNGKLYLFYKTVFANTLKSWQEENPENLLKKADLNWNKIKK